MPIANLFSFPAERHQGRMPDNETDTIIGFDTQKVPPFMPYHRQAKSVTKPWQNQGTCTLKDRL